VLSFGRARRSAYAARRLLRGNGEPLPVFRIDASGASHEAGQLHLAYPHGCVALWHSGFEWPLDATMRDGWFEGIPYPLQDMRPEGFLGRAFAHQHAALLQVGDDPRSWSDDDVLYAMSLLGSDQAGNLILGERAFRLWQQRLRRPLELVTDATLQATYLALAQRAMDQGLVGSSAGGEFPKFTAARELDGLPVHVIVKFSGQDDSPGTQRWADLLVCEHLAAACVSTLPGLAAAPSILHRFGGRTFLEVRRFDRHGAHGRLPMCSWAALNNTWFGLARRPWPQGIARLRGEGLVADAARDAVERLWHFGELIANTDMHDGNLSFMPREGQLELAPSYDMLPMLYAPQPGVELPERSFTPSLPMPAQRPAWRQAAAAAREFWTHAAQDLRISMAFRQTCARNAEAVREALALVGG
jgi:hypothetical protein